MKLYEAYKGLILENQVQACVSKFGQELFSPQLGGDEPNTNLEDDYAELIHHFTGGEFGDIINPDFIEMARNLKRCVSAYPEVLHPNGYAWRGTKTNLKALLKDFNDVGNKIRMGQPFKMYYTARTPIQSWSDDEDIAMDEFGQSGPMLLLLLQKFDKAKENGTVKEFIDHVIEHKLDTRVPVVLKYNTSPDDFIFKGKYFNYLSRFDENEILRIDNRPIEVEAKIYPREFSARVFDLLDTIRNS